MPVDALLACSRAIHGQMRLRDKARPVVITMPVNLRSYFPSESARNFFTTINVGYDFSRQPDDLDAVTAHVHRSFRENLTEKRLHEQINALCFLEHNIPLRLVPLLLKDRILRAVIAVEEAQANRADIFDYAEKSTVAEDYRAFIEEFLKGADANIVRQPRCRSPSSRLYMT